MSYKPCTSSSVPATKTWTHTHATIDEFSISLTRYITFFFLKELLNPIIVFMSSKFVLGVPKQGLPYTPATIVVIEKLMRKLNRNTKDKVSPKIVYIFDS